MTPHLDKQKLISEVLLQPWFIDLKTARAVRRILPMNWFHKMRYYFDDYGCMICGNRDVLYDTNGMCDKCTDRVQKRILRSLARRHVPVMKFKPDSLNRVDMARKLLSDLVVKR